jgi:zinc protease
MVYSRSILPTYSILLISLLATLVWADLTSIAWAQSGRKRDTPPANNNPRNPPATNSNSGNNASSGANKKDPANSSSNKNAPLTKILVPTDAAIVAQEYQGLTASFRFKNGITLVVREDHSTPLAACTVRVKAGTVNEPEATPGVAQVVQKLLSEPTNTNDPRLQLRQLAQVTSQVDYESTTYSFIGYNANINKLLELQFTTLQKPTFTDEEIARALKQLSEQEQRRLQDPLQYSQQRLRQLASDRTTTANIINYQQLTKSDIQQFYDTYYQGSNLVVIITGDVIADQVRLISQKFLGTIKANPKINPVSPAKPAALATKATKVRYLAERAEINQTVVSIGYPAPEIKDKEFATLELLRAVMVLGRGAVFTQALLETAYSAQIQVEYLPSPQGNIFAFQTQCSPENLAKAQGALLDKIEFLRRTIIAPGTLLRAKSLLEKGFYDTKTDLVALSQALAFWETHGGYKNFDNYLTQLKAVTAEQVQQFAAKYFQFKTAAVYEYEPQNAPPRIPGTDPLYTLDRFEAYISVLAPRTYQELTREDIVLANEVPIAKQGAERESATSNTNGFIVDLQPQPVRDFSTLRGPRAYVREDSSRPTLAIGFYFQGGRIQETPEQAGLTELMLRAILRGTSKRTTAEVALNLEQLGAKIYLVNEPDFFGFTVDTLSRNAEAVMQLIINLLETPALDKGEINQEKQRLLAELRAQRDDLTITGLQLAQSALYSDHPYSALSLGREASLSLLTEKDVEQWYQKNIKRQVPLVTIVGDTAGSALVGRFLAEGFSRKELDQAISVRNLVFSAQRQRLITHKGNQSIIAVNFFGPEGKNPDIFSYELAVHFLNNVINNAKATLQAQGTNFDFTINYQPRLLAGHLAITLNTTPEKESLVRQMLDQELRKISKAELTDNELETARNQALTQLLAQLRQHPERAAVYARHAYFSLPVINVDTLVEKLKAVTKEEVKRTLTKYFASERQSTAVVRGTPETNK